MLQKCQNFYSENLHITMCELLNIISKIYTMFPIFPKFVYHYVKFTYFSALVPQLSQLN